MKNFRSEKYNNQKYKFTAKSNRMKMIGERNSEPDIILLKIIQSEQQREKRLKKKKKNRTSGSDGTIAKGLVFVSSDCQQETRKCDAEKMFEEIMDENLTYLEKDTYLQSHKVE